MESPTAELGGRSGIDCLMIGACFLAAVSALGWLVESTNTEGEHDAQRSPLFALTDVASAEESVERSG
jgi:hypothetical protein